MIFLKPMRPTIPAIHDTHRRHIASKNFFEKINVGHSRVGAAVGGELRHGCGVARWRGFGGLCFSKNVELGRFPLGKPVQFNAGAAGFGKDGGFVEEDDLFAFKGGGFDARRL